MLSLNSFFQYKEIISTSKLPCHNPLVMKYYNVFSIFFLEYENSPFTRFSILYLFNTHNLHGPCLGVLYSWLTGHSNTLLHNIAPGIYIVINVEYGVQLHFKISLNKLDRKKQ